MGEGGGFVAHLSKQSRQTSVARAAQRPSLRWLEVGKKNGGVGG